MTAASMQPAPGSRGSRGRGPGRRAGRRKTAVLEAACRVIADRGADATRFADVAAESVPVSTLQYYFGSREDMLVAAFRHASGTEIAALEADVAAMSDPWDRLERIVTTALTGYSPGAPEAAGHTPSAPEAGRLWIESWHFGIRDPEMRADALEDYRAWRRLVADAVRHGVEQGRFGTEHAPEWVARLAIALVDGMGIPLALADPDVSGPGAVQDVLAALRELLRPDR
jgi:AcrR family transcriptional regulator